MIKKQQAFYFLKDLIFLFYDLKRLLNWKNIWGLVMMRSHITLKIAINLMHHIIIIFIDLKCICMVKVVRLDFSFATPNSKIYVFCLLSFKVTWASQEFGSLRWKRRRSYQLWYFLISNRFYPFSLFVEQVTKKLRKEEVWNSKNMLLAKKDVHWKWGSISTKL